MLRHASPHRLWQRESRKGKRKLGKGNEWWGGVWDGINPLCYTQAWLHERTVRWRSVSDLACSHQVCTQAAVVRGTPVYSAAPGVASSPTRPAGRLWSLPPTDAPSVASYTKQKHRSHVKWWDFANWHCKVNTGEHVVLLHIHSYDGEGIDRTAISSVH